MKTILMVIVGTITVFLFSHDLYAQYNDQGTISSLSNNMNGFFSMGSTPYQNNQYGNASVMNSQGNLVLKQSEANINNQTAYGMALDNRTKYTRTYFENRQLNRFYRDLEEWQKQERVQLKKYGIYDRESIERLYGIQR